MEVVQFGKIHGRKNERVWMFFFNMGYLHNNK